MFSPNVGDPCTYTGRGGTKSHNIVIVGPYQTQFYGEPPTTVYDIARDVSVDEQGIVQYSLRLNGVRPSDASVPGRISPIE